MNARKAALWTIGLAPVVLLAVIAYLHFLDNPPTVFLLRSSVAFLTTLEMAYLAALAAIVLGGPIAFRLVAVRRGPARSRPAQCLLLAGSLGFVFGCAEITAALLGVGGRPPADRPEANEAPGPLPPLAPLPTTFPDPAEPGEVRLAVIGESSAEGVPYNAYFSPGGLIAWQLGRIFPDRTVRVDSLAFSGETLEKQYDKLRWLSHKPDILVVYCGHNEYSARFAWSRDLPYYIDHDQPTGLRAWLATAERFSTLCRWFSATADRLRVAIPPPPEGHRDLVDAPAFTPAEARRVRDDFSRRLRTIAQWAEGQGIVTVLIAPPSNESGFEPNRSFLDQTTTRADREAFASDFRQARSAEARDPAEAETRYRDLLKRGPGFAEAHFQLGRLLEARGEFVAAADHDRLARDLDALPMRCPTPLLLAYHQAGTASGAAVIDGPALFRQIGPNGLLNDHLFHDGMHPSLAGQIALAEAVLAALKARRALGWPRTVEAPTIDPAEAAARFGIDGVAWYRICKWGAMFYDRTAPARYDPSHRREMLARFEEAALRLQRNEKAEDLGLPNIGVPRPTPLPPVGPSWLQINTD